MTDSSDRRRLVAWTVGLVVVATILCWAAYEARRALLLIYISALFAMGFTPLVRVVERQALLGTGRRRIPRWLAILTVYLAILGTLAGIGVLVVPPLIRQARQLWNDLPDHFQALQSLALRYDIIQDRLTWRDLFEAAPEGTGDIVAPVIDALSGLVGGIVGVFTILILTFYLLIESQEISAYFLRFFPRQRRPRVAAAARKVTFRVSAWLMGQLLLAGIIGATTAIALGVMGVPYFYVLALIAAIGEMIPVVGPILAALPAVGIAFTSSLQLAVAVTIFFVVQQQLENHILVPKIMESQVGVSAVAVIVALLIGASMLGIVGAILAIPTAAILVVLLDEVVLQEPD